MAFYIIIVLVVSLVGSNCDEGDADESLSVDDIGTAEDWGLTPEDFEVLKTRRTFSFSVIFPGTKWCGDGDIADGPEDFGKHVEADKCCKEHDECTDTIKAGETKYNLTNVSPFTRLACWCDNRFRECLDDAGTRTADIIGAAYFHKLSWIQKCYRVDYPITGCAKKVGILFPKCVEYTYDTNRERRYQWVDTPVYMDNVIAILNLLKDLFYFK